MAALTIAWAKEKWPDFYRIGSGYDDPNASTLIANAFNYWVKCRKSLICTTNRLSL